MLLWLRLLAMAAGVWLCPVVGAHSLCRVHTVRTAKVFNVVQRLHGERLYFDASAPRLLKHPCHKHLALYLGKQVFLTRDDFKSSLLPFTVPESMAVGVPKVTSAHFAGPLLLLVINYQVYIYNYQDNIWGKATGIQQPVSHVSGDNCCNARRAFCLSISNSVFAYARGEKISRTNMYFSDTGGQSFRKYVFHRQEELSGTLGGIFYFHSLSQVGLLMVNNRKGQFAYSHHPLNRSFGLPFDYNGTLNVLTLPGQRGVLIFWCAKSLLFSLNSGQLVDTVQVRKGDQLLHPSIFDANIIIQDVTFNENELAVLSREQHLYYGSVGALWSSILKISEDLFWSAEVALMFTGTGVLHVLSPLGDAFFLAFDFQQCSISIQATLMEPDLQVGKCKVELLEAIFAAVYTIDMNSELLLQARLIARLGTSPIPLAMVSNPHSLGLQASISERGDTFDGSTMYILDIHLKQQHHWGRTDPNFTYSIKRPTISSLTVDIANKELSCVDMKPLSTLISLGCDLKKKIVVQSEITACSKGILDPVVLQDNYSYVIEKESYDPNFRGRKAAKDLTVFYPYEDLGCPRLLYYDTPWRPVVELWQAGQFQEVVTAEHVLLEVNGLFTYSYALSARAAGCTAQPQNWSTILGAHADGGPSSWNRESYVSCRDPSNTQPLRWPQAEYQILGGSTDNEIIFEQRNGIYVFFLAIVDPYYSYCHLHTTFSVYVYGAYPLFSIPSDIAIALLVAAILLGVWLVYWVPKLRHRELDHSIQASHPCQDCLGALGCVHQRQ
ncbi:cation channel sperm-associated protein subunit delta [Ochotona curzoniae]|uniref:cation channel sperm-associated protein subunit delta n=1 Tax=Ochotona curzoniae TaxID=130825 RepID=UPI001B351BFE|nr:cation channel sperm-associated protein subunit delta [Ochotona curzoniae]